MGCLTYRRMTNEETKEATDRTTITGKSSTTSNPSLKTSGGRNKRSGSDPNSKSKNENADFNDADNIDVDAMTYNEENLRQSLIWLAIGSSFQPLS